MNNDILIPRSILKRNNPGNLIKDKRLIEATSDFFKYQEEQRRRTLQESDFEIGKYDAIFGKGLESHNPLLSPKISMVL